MKKRIKLISLIVAAGLIIAAAVVAIITINRNNSSNGEQIKIVATNFPAYDFARAITGDKAEIKMLLQPGADIHHYEPTPQDIIDIKNSNLFIYTGGESDAWVASILNDVDQNSTHVFKMTEHVSNQTDLNHPWTSIENSTEIIAGLSYLLSSICPEYSNLFQENANNYITSLSTINQNFKNIIEQSSHPVFIVADRFPFLNFVTDHNLEYLSPYDSCDEHSEPNPQKIADIINRIKNNSLHYIFKIELTSSDLANTIANETGAEILTFHSAHNISPEDFESGITYAKLLEQNLENFEKALE